MACLLLGSLNWKLLGIFDSEFQNSNLGHEYQVWENFGLLGCPCQVNFRAKNLLLNPIQFSSADAVVPVGFALHLVVEIVIMAFSRYKNMCSLTMGLHWATSELESRIKPLVGQRSYFISSWYCLLKH